MTVDVKTLVQSRLGAADRRAQERRAMLDDARREAVRTATEDYLRRWGQDTATLAAGIQGDGDRCVLANSLGGAWNGETWAFAEGTPEFPIPEEVKEFIDRFDAGEYPDLIIEPQMEEG